MIATKPISATSCSVSCSKNTSNLVHWASLLCKTLIMMNYATQQTRFQRGDLTLPNHIWLASWDWRSVRNLLTQKLSKLGTVTLQISGSFLNSTRSSSRHTLSQVPSRVMPSQAIRISYKIENVYTNICWPLKHNQPTTTDFKGKLGPNVGSGLVTSCYGRKTACRWLRWGSMGIDDSPKVTWVGVALDKTFSQLSVESNKETFGTIP